MRNAELQHRARSLRNQSTDAERYLWQHLRRSQINGHRFRRQVPIAGFIADFACLESKLVVELDGGQHQQRIHYDKDRDRELEAQGFRVLRFWNDQVFRETEAVLEQIMRALEVSSPHPNPPPQAGEGM
jgi:very-short-patch-repair endonuclease